MGALLHASCDSCDYRSEQLYLIPSRLLFRCAACSDIVNPKRIPFRFDVPPCPKCGQALERKHRIVFGPAACESGGYTCPRCQQGALHFRTLAHASSRIPISLPTPSAHVHGYFSFEGEVIFRDLNPTVFIAKLAEPVPDLNERDPVECQFIGLEGSALGLRFVRK
ncbi:MAG TPA: hypothetical protein VKD72_09890, partial [Gemmataceae bacterium]|nr:hypothetical protein [Gemmataceae bacterium]